MRLKSFPGLWLGVMLLLFCAAVPRIAEASIIYSNFQFVSPITAFGSGNDVLVNGTVPGEGASYTLSGEFCQTGSCTGDLPSATTDTVRFTNVSLSCTGSGTCNQIDISFQADGTSTTSTDVLLLYLENASATGTTPTGSGQFCISDSGHVCSSTAQGAQSASFQFTSGLTGTTNYTYSVTGPFTLIADFHLDGLDAGSTVSIPNSFDILDIAPEPGGLLLLPTGLAGLMLLRRFHRRKSIRKRAN